MSIANNAQSIAAQQELLRPDLPMLYMASSRLWKRIKARETDATSTRPARIPFNVQSGGKFRVGNFDGGDLGLGSGPNEVYGNLACTSFLQASAYTALTEWATDSNEKAIKNYVTLTNQQAADTFAAYMDAVLQGDGSNTLDSVVALTSPNGLQVNNANLFQDNQTVDIWSALGGTFRGSVTISTSDINQNTIWLTTAYPAGTQATDLLLVEGSAGVANSGLYGLRYYQNGSNAGTFMGINRSTYPGRFSSNYINVGGSLTPAVVRALEAKIKLSMGIDKADESDLIAHCSVDMQAAWENNALQVQSVIMNQVKGDESVDMLKKSAPTVIAGRPMLVNERAKPGLIDFLSLKEFWRIETKALDYYEVGGQTVFPAYGTSGGVASSLMFYLVIMTQIGVSNARMNAYMDNISVPTNYFNH